jgi:hypothetical protein
MTTKYDILSNILYFTKFLMEEGSKLLDNKSDPTIMTIVDAWNHSYFECKIYILNRLNNTFYDVNNLIKSAKTLWEALDKRYKAKDVGMKKFIIGKFSNFKIVDSRTTMSQI